VTDAPVAGLRNSQTETALLRTKYLDSFPDAVMPSTTRAVCKNPPNLSL
jgi:hypothetical protein